MPALPWTAGPAAEDPTPRSSIATDGTIVFASRLQLRRWRDVPAFLRSSMRVRAAAAHAPGCIGVSLDARALRRTFFTLSAWVDEESLARFVQGDLHVAVMGRWRAALRDARFARWDGDARPTWDTAHERLRATG